MVLVDTNVISEARKGRRADPGVVAFWADVARLQTPLFLASVSIDELRRGVELIRHRGDHQLDQLLDAYNERVLALDGDGAQLWGRLCVPDPHHAIDKPIAAIARLHDLRVVTRNTAGFAGTGVRLLNPFRGS